MSKDKKIEGFLFFLPQIFIFTLIITLLIFSCGCVEENGLNDFYSYKIMLEADNAKNIKVIVPMPYYRGQSYEEIIKDPKFVEGGKNLSYEIVETEFGEMLSIHFLEHESITFYRDAGHDIDEEAWVNENEPLLHPRVNHTFISLKYPQKATYQSPVYVSFEGEPNTTIKITIWLMGHDWPEGGYSDEIFKASVISIPDGEWIFVNGTTHQLMG